MTVDRRFEDLVHAGWRVLATDFDNTAFCHWREQVLSCFTLLCGSDHAYTKHFRNKVAEAKSFNVLSGQGMPSVASTRDEHGMFLKQEPSRVTPP